MRQIQQELFLSPRHHFLVEEVVVLLGPDDPPEKDLVLVDGQPPVAVVKDDFNVGGDHAGAGALVEQSLSEGKY